jgi:hypothetical protein
MPLAAHATLDMGTLAIHAAWGDPHVKTTELIHAHAQCPLDVSAPDALNQATHLGIRVAQQLIAQGAIAV